MLSTDFCKAFNMAVKHKGPVPLPVAYKRIFVQELKNGKYETRMRVNSKWCSMTLDQERMIYDTLKQNGVVD